MIEGIVGLPGSGKTLYAVRRLLKAHQRKRMTIANIHSRTGAWEFGLWNDISSAGNCLAVIDEAHMWFSARNWTKTAQLELAVFQQSRKEGIDLLWVAQHEARVDVAIREVTAYYWRCRHFGRLCVASKVTPDDAHKVIGREFFLLGDHLTRHYYTEERIGDRDGVGYGFGGSLAYRRDGKGAPELLPGAELKANYYRVEGPLWTTWTEGGVDLIRAIAAAVKGWRIAGEVRRPEEVVRTFFRDGGKIVDLEGGVTNHVDVGMWACVLSEVSELICKFPKVGSILNVTANTSPAPLR
jgi:hypothetical protein